MLKQLITNQTKTASYVAVGGCGQDSGSYVYYTRIRHILQLFIL